MRVVILVDYRGCFWSSTSNVRTDTTMDVGRILRLVSEAGHEPEVVTYADVDLLRDWEGVVVVYTSSEDAGLAYKGYIEDVVQALSLTGARLVPGFPLLRAHHNKVFMEFLRKLMIPADPLATHTSAFGTLEDFKVGMPDLFLPLVVKSAAGAGSLGVRVASSETEVWRAARSASRSDPLLEEFREIARQRARPGYVRGSTHRAKFIVQEFIPGLPGDFKVLKYGRRYFVVFRGNRSTAATASGGGNLDFDIDSHVDADQLLAFAADVAACIDSPFLSLDIGAGSAGFFLIEFQALHFGPATLEKGNFHFIREVDGSFTRVEGRIGLEQAFVDALCEEIDG